MPRGRKLSFLDSGQFLAAAIAAAVVISVGLFTAFGYATAPPAGTEEVALPFMLDAWNTNYNQWTDCTNVAISKGELDAFCKCKDSKYSGASKCWFVSTSSRYYQTGAKAAPDCIGKGTATGGGSGMPKVACTVAATVCSGTIALDLPASAETASTVTASISGLKDCSGKGKTVYIMTPDCLGATPCSIDLTASDSGSCTFSAPLEAGSKTYVACVDKDGNGKYIAADGEVATKSLSVTAPGPVCGNGNIEAGEDCEEGNLGGKTCQNFGFFSGSLGCSNCKFDTSGCTALPELAEQKILTGMTSGSTKTVTITKPAMDISSISIASKQAVSAMNVYIEKLAEKPAELDAPSTSTAYYMNINTNSSAAVKNATISFKVEKAWAAANNINIDTLALSRYVSGAWTKLQTQKISEDDTYIYLKAITPGLSYFAVWGEQASAPEPSAPVCSNGIVETGEECDGTNFTDTCASKGFASGNLVCNNCIIDTSGCTAASTENDTTETTEGTTEARCGNGQIDSGEECDGSSLGGATCEGLGYARGTLACSNCMLDKSGCAQETPSTTSGETSTPSETPSEQPSATGTTETASADAQAALTAAVSEISSAQSAGKNVSAAIALLNAANQAFASHDYATAQSKAGDAKQAALSAQPPAKVTVPTSVFVAAGAIAVIIAVVFLFKKGIIKLPKVSIKVEKQIEKPKAEQPKKTEQPKKPARASKKLDITPH